MVQPVIVPREEHSLSRTLIDTDALKVLTRLQQHGYVAYLVGGSVRDLLLGRRPKDFDIGTSAHPYQVKRLFRNCWIIGRRFRLAHVRFGSNTIEVATFRKHVSPTAPESTDTPEQPPTETSSSVAQETHADRLVHRDNTFGTPEEDAFRRDFTINALFYDIGARAIIDYMGGLGDLRAGTVRCIGDPSERFQEDPVRMLRAVAMAARLDFAIDPPIDHAIVDRRADIARSASARLIEEFYKLLRTGVAERAFRMMAERRLLEPIASELQEKAGERLWHSLRSLDAYRSKLAHVPDVLTNSILLGSLLVPLGYTLQTLAPKPPSGGESRGEPRLSLGMLPLARRDVERLRQILSLQRRLVDTSLSPRARSALSSRGPFREALTWLEIHGDTAMAEHWHGFLEGTGTLETSAEAARPKRRRRRKRRRGPAPASG